MTSGIVGFGAYVPRLRMSRQAVHQANAWFAPGLKGKAKGERSLANWDEDTITMAVAAARDCLPPSHESRALSGVVLASTTLPFADRLNAGVVAAALDLDETVSALDVAGSRRAGLSAVNLTLDRVRQGEAPVLVAASDLRISRAASASELEFGDGAAALLLGSENVLAERLSSSTLTVDFVDRFRQSGEDIDYVWEERWIRDEGVSKIAPKAAAEALRKAGLSGAEVDHFIFPTSLKGMSAQVARQLEIKPEAVVDDLADRLGDTGVGHGLLLLTGLLPTARPGAVILMLEFGNGAEAVVWRTTDRLAEWTPQRGLAGWLERGVTENNYTRMLAYRGQLELEKGMRGEQDKKTALTTLHRHRRAIMGLVGGRCTQTGSVHFPPSRLSYDPQGAALDTQVPYPLADRPAHILSWSAEYLSYYPSPPHHYGQIDFAGGGRILMEFTDVAPGDVEAGTPMEMVFRVKDRDQTRRFTRYFWKATPVRAAERTN
ncbi:MAG: 3-hydroxy-3-methylglutaryl CoA synthase [Sphingomonadales bacterium RIFCSPHIGHO2_01_FULL_65_20]|jgi:3-hydroxy-3-methylglutaryl CoA synthase|nr:MAG: 3-hydroxy-3-methylglutaryl CoA synthase [Sphingomonadales bacterium RIFCSPHIGHO2_01_FULL_65_20]